MSRLLRILLVAVAYQGHAFVAVQEESTVPVLRRPELGRTPGCTSGTGSPSQAEPKFAVSGASNGLCGVAGVALGLFFALTTRLPALAADIENGQGIFLANCAACHAGGNNAVQPDKKLKKDALETYGMYDVERIKYQVTNGKNAMPAFGERLGPDDIEDVANYVIDQANKGWP